MNAKEHWAHIKPLLAYSLILILSLRVYGYWLDDKAQKKARWNWYEKQTKILDTAQGIACDDQFKDSSFDEVMVRITEYLNNVLAIENDPDFRLLTDIEHRIFHDSVRQKSLVAYDVCQRDASFKTSLG